MYIFKKLYGDNYPRYYLDKFQKAPLEKVILSNVSAKKKKNSVLMGRNTANYKFIA